MTVKSRRLGQWVFRQREPKSQAPSPLVLLLHGLTGDEKVMWVFASRLPESAFLVSPRGIYPYPSGGYSWHNHEIGEWPSIDDLRPAVEAVRKLMLPSHFPTADLSGIHIVGFSQGAALGFAYALLYPEDVLSISGLSGFLPGGIDALVERHKLTGKPIFIAHGTQDKQVPVEMAREAIRKLQKAGADVTYCEDDVGHKLSSTCFSSLEHFSAMNIAAD
jgi:phospholipase/carboxylesterase